MVAVAKLSKEEAELHGDLVHRSRLQAFTEMFDLFKNWEPRSQAFFINHGANIASLAGGLSGLFLYRRHFRCAGPAAYKCSKLVIIIIGF